MAIACLQFRRHRASGGGISNFSNVQKWKARECLLRRRPLPVHVDCRASDPASIRVFRIVLGYQVSKLASGITWKIEFPLTTVAEKPRSAEHRFACDAAHTSVHDVIIAMF